MIESNLEIPFKNKSKEYIKAIIKGRKYGMNKAMLAIRNATRKLYKNVDNGSKTKESKYIDNISDAARVMKYRDDNYLGEAFSGVQILGISKKFSGTFRTRFFEGGTAERKTKDFKRKSKNGKIHLVKGGSRGKISNGKWYFKKAVEEKAGTALETITNSINKAIEKIKNG